MRSLILWLLALGLGLTGYDAYRDREERGDGLRFDRGVVVAPSTVDQVQSSEGGNGLPPPPGGKR